MRHPFLLSLERIEGVEGHPLIETATGHLKPKDLFEQYRQSGLGGIPRAELLSHLQDAADVMDYISQENSLQHLDIKPENLLLVGRRAKVADFGLVKDLQDVNSSIIGGLTPVYAAPELFDGRPNVHSDQYSLAIVYQELLTGTAAAVKVGPTASLPPSICTAVRGWTACRPTTSRSSQGPSRRTRCNGFPVAAR